MEVGITTSKRIVKVRITTGKIYAKFLLPTVGFTNNYKAFTVHIAMWNYVLNLNVAY